MTFKERLDSLREKVKGKIKPESSAEELDEYNGILAELDEIEKDHDGVLTENTKFKDTIVRMALTQGDDNTPPSDPAGNKPRSMEQFIEDFKKDNK